MKTFYQVLGNTLVATVTTMVIWFALTFYIYLESKSVLATGIISGIFMMFSALSSIWFGTIVDSFKKKQVMIASSIISLLFFSIGLIFYLVVDKTIFTEIGNPLLWIFVLILMLGVISGNLRSIALPTIVTILFPQGERDNANGLVGSTTGMAFLVVSVISGVLVGLAGMQYVLILAVLLTAIVLVHMFFINIPEEEIVKTDGVPKFNFRETYKTVVAVPGLLALIIFTTLNNLLGGVYMALMDPYGLSLVSVEVWGFLWGLLSTGFIVGGLLISKKGLGKSPLRTLFLTNIMIWTVSIFFTMRSNIFLLMIGMYIYMLLVPFIEASENTIIQKVIDPKKQGKVFGFAHSIEQAASPLTAFAIGPITQLVFIPFMTDGKGVELIGSWFGTGADRGMALVFVLTGIVGLTMTLIAMRGKYYKLLENTYLN